MHVLPPNVKGGRQGRPRARRAPALAGPAGNFQDQATLGPAFTHGADDVTGENKLPRRRSHHSTANPTARLEGRPLPRQRRNQLRQFIDRLGRCRILCASGDFPRHYGAGHGLWPLDRSCAGRTAVGASARAGTRQCLRYYRPADAPGGLEVGRRAQSRPDLQSAPRHLERQRRDQVDHYRPQHRLRGTGETRVLQTQSLVADVHRRRHPVHDRGADGGRRGSGGARHFRLARAGSCSRCFWSCAGWSWPCWWSWRSACSTASRRAGRPHGCNG